MASKMTYLDIVLLHMCAYVRLICLRSAFYIITLIALCLIFGFTALVSKIAYEYDQVASTNWQYSSFDQWEGRWDGLDMAPVPEGARFAFRHGLAAVPATKHLIENKEQQITKENTNYGEPKGKLLPRECLQYLINPTYVCSNKDVNIVAYVNTRVDNFEKRKLIRDTWGSQKLFNQIGFRTVFIVGITLDDATQFELLQESIKYNDVIQGNFIDNYDNLTLKGISALHWIERYCNTTKFVLKIDDDMFLNTFTLIDLTNAMINKSDIHKILFCREMDRSVKRDGKYRISWETYRFNYFPSFCGGPAYLLSYDVAAALYNESLYKPVFRLEDVHITGFLRESLKLRIRNAESVSAPHAMRLEHIFLGPKWDTLLSSHLEDEQQFRYVWKKLSLQVLRHKRIRHKVTTNNADLTTLGQAIS